MFWPGKVISELNPVGMKAAMWQWRERVVKKWGDQAQALLSMNFAGMRRGEMEKSQRNVSLFRWIC